MVSISNIFRSVLERPKLYIGLLLVLFTAFLIYLLVIQILAGIAPQIKQQVLIGFLVLAILGILAGLLLSRVETFREFYEELTAEHPFIVIIAGALLFSVLGTMYALYSQTIGAFSIFESVPLFTVTLGDMLYKLAVSFIKYFLQGIVLVASILLGTRIG